MKYLFIDTSYSFIISIIVDDKIVYYNSLNNTLTSSKIMSILDLGLSNANLKLNDIDKIFIVTGPGSFTGIRVGVTLAKTIGYLLNIPLIELSELEFLATTSVDTKYVVPIIDARRGYVYGGIYDNNLNVIYKDSHILLEDLKEKIDDTYTFVDNCLNVDLLKIIKKNEFDEAKNPHLLVPNYLKNTEAEEKLNDKRD